MTREIRIKNIKRFFLICSLAAAFAFLLLMCTSCAPTAKKVYLWNGDVIRVTGESDLSVNIYDGYVEVQSGFTVTSDDIIIGSPIEE